MMMPFPTSTRAITQSLRLRRLVLGVDALTPRSNGRCAGGKAGCLAFFSSSRDAPPAPPASAKEDPNLRFASHLKNPIVQQLWSARGKAKAQAVVLGDGAIDAEQPRTPSESETNISYAFSTDAFLQETYRNPWGQIRFGKILEDLDALAGNIAFAHVQDPALNIVTASVDRILLRGVPSMEEDQHLCGKVTYVGTSSMEIRIQCSTNSGKEWMEAYFTFVAMDPVTKRPTRIPQLTPETSAEHVFFEKGEHRATEKKAARKRGACEELNSEIEAEATTLLKESGPLLNMPSLANPNSILSRQTELQSSELAQPQTRNLANQIFGGFLMRRSYELAYSTAYVFGGKRPVLYEVDQVNFGLPVSVGDLTNFHAKVLYTTSKDDMPNFDVFDGQKDIPLVSIEVEAWIIDPETASAKRSNQFYFTFALPQTEIRKVLPANMEEARSMAVRMAAERAQEADV